MNTRRPVILALAALVAVPAVAQASTVPKLSIAESKLVQKRLVYKISPRIDYSSRTIGPCVRISRLAVDCSADFKDTETDGKETITTMRRFKVTVRRSAVAGGYRTAGSIVQTSYTEA